MTGLANTINIRHMIVHKLDHRKNTVPECATRLTPNHPRAIEFVANHIASNRVHHRAREARFLDLPTNSFAQSADITFDRINDIDTFISQSQTMAQLLFDTMRTRSRISPGDLVVCVFDEVPATPEPFLRSLSWIRARAFAESLERSAPMLR